MPLDPNIIFGQTAILLDNEAEMGNGHKMQIVVLAGITILSNLPDAAAAPQTNQRQLSRSALISHMQQYVDRKQMSGAVVLVASHGKIKLKSAIGLADVERKISMSEETLFWIASISKPITTCALMTLVDEGKVKLDDPVYKYIPSFKKLALAGGQAPRTAPTIRQLLCHTSGITMPVNILDMPLNEVAEATAALPLKFEPGTQWRYEYGHHIVARIIELKSGMKFEEYLTHRVLQPLGMKDTTFYPDEKQRQRMAVLYEPVPILGGLRAAVPTLVSFNASRRRPVNPGAGLASTAADLFCFYQMILNGGELNGKRITSSAAIKEMLRNQTDALKCGYSDGGYAWGLGFCLVEKPQNITIDLQPHTFGHGSAYGCDAWADPSKQSVFIILLARTGFGNPDTADVRKTFFHDVKSIVE